MRSLRLSSLVLVAALAACAESDPPVLGGGEQGEGPSTNPDGPTGDSKAALNEYLSGLPYLPVAPAQPKTEVACGDACPDDAQEGKTYCTYTRFEETAHHDKFVALQPNSATLWPGSIVRGADAAHGLLTPVGAPLAPVTFSISLENIAGSPKATLDEPSLSAFREARNEMLAAGVTGATPAALDFEVMQVNSESQVSAAVGAGVDWPGSGDLSASFNFDSTTKKTKILVNFTQAYYTVDIDTPSAPADFFEDGTTVDQIDDYVSADSPPLYVQSITYGRRVIFSVETERSSQEVKAALEATYAGAVSASVNVSFEHKQVLSESTIRAFVLGGSGDDATGAINGFEGLVEYIQKGGNYSKDSPGAPIAYKLAYLDNAVATLAFTTDYAERTCVKNRADMRVTLKGIEHVGGDDVGGNIELFGQIGIAYPTPDSPLVDCWTGGEYVAIWYSPDGSWISFPEYTTWTPSSSSYVDLHDLPIDPSQDICFFADMWEEDGSTNELSADDDYGFATKLVSFSDGWTGTHHIVTHGTGENSVDAELSITLE